MMKHHNFAEVEVFMVETRIGKNFKDRAFKKFTEIAKDLGFSVKQTKGNFTTHKLVNGNIEDFNVLLNLTREAI